ncbi:MAG: tetratricopeptide repeat protein [Pseudobdellovibrio sp.]
MKKLVAAALVTLLFSGCLVTRSEVGQMDQDNTYGQKNASNQNAAAQKIVDAGAVPANQVVNPVVDEKDELIRNLSGRVEVLENQLTALQKDRDDEKKQNEQKLATLQEAITKLATQEQADEKAAPNEKDNELVSSDEAAAKKAGTSKKDTKAPVTKSDNKMSPYEAAEQYFAKKEWKKAILSFHQYTDEAPKGKLVPDAKYKIGVCFQELGMKDEAMAYYEEVAANYKATDAGKKSKTRLAKLKK